MVLISEWNTDKIQMIDLNNPYLHQEPLGLLERGSVVDFTSLATIGQKKVLIIENVTEMVLQH